MAKRGTTQPLVVWVAPEWETRPEIVALRGAGHSILTVAGGGVEGPPDLILHPAAHLWNDMMWDFLPAAIATARKRKREAK